MNPILELEEDAVMSPVAEALTEEQIQAIDDPDALLQQLEACKTRFTTLRPVDPLTVKQCAALIETCTFASRYAERRRTEIVKPLNALVDDANAIWQPIVKGFKEIASVRGAEVSKWIDDQLREQARLQRKAIDDARAAQEALDRKAEQERQEAERIRQLADHAKTIEEAEVLHLQADKLEKKADLHELKAEQVVTPVVVAQPKAIDLGSSTFSAKSPKRTYLLAGWDRFKPLRLTDSKLASLIGDAEKLPDGLKFIIQHSELSPVLLNKSFGVIKFPAPFAEIDDYGGSSVRTKG